MFGSFSNYNELATVAFLANHNMKGDDTVHAYSHFPSYLLASLAIAQHLCSLYFFLISCMSEVNELEKMLDARRNVSVVIIYVSIEVPYDSPNTDGIDQDSSTNVCIEESSIETRDDAIAIKSGWDEYGISYGRPISNITIRRVTCSSPFAGIAIGSEASGGVESIILENLNIYNTGIGLHIKTTAGRGGYVKNVRFFDVNMNNVQTAVRTVEMVGDHPDNKFNPNALPVVNF